MFPLAPRLRRISRQGSVLAVFLLLLFLLCAPAAVAEGRPQTFPVEMEGLLRALAAPGTQPASGEFPRSIAYDLTRWNMRSDTLEKTVRKVQIAHRPQRIVPHSVGTAEILWAIAPRERIAAVHRNCLNPDYSFIAGAIPESMPVYGSEDAEVVIGLRSDLILTTYYSSEEFKNRLRLASVPFVELGFFGNLPAIQEQIEFVGRIIGEEGAARQLVATMARSLADIRDYVRRRSGGARLRVLYYDHQGMVAGAHSTFDAFCDFLEVENVAAANGIRFFKQIDYETILKWDPDLIIVPEGSGLQRELQGAEILQSAKAVRTGRIRSIPNVYLMASSQFAVASLNYLGGLLYEE